MRTQLALCLALGGEPDLLILDEPTTGLDPIARPAFLGALIGEVAATGKTVFFSPHILPDVEVVADTLGILRAGRLLVSDEVDALKERQALVRLSYAEPLSDETYATLRRIPGIVWVEREGRSAQARIHGGVAATVAALQAVATPTGIDTTRLGLEDIFLFYAQPAQNSQSGEVRA
jgi:ABC-2 type transport system ATP-binding protein